MAPAPYDEIVARRIRAKRAAKRLSQESVAVRMRALGFEWWTRQTVGSTEKPSRRVTAAEIVGLALALETSVPTLLTAVPDDEAVAFPGGQLAPKSVEKLVTGLNDKSVQWQDDKPVFTAGKSAWMAGDPDAPDVVKAAWAREDEH
jgi:transcriptional regulator with XRE-family HTH domain